MDHRIIKVETTSQNKNIAVSLYSLLDSSLYCSEGQDSLIECVHQSLLMDLVQLNRMVASSDVTRGSEGWVEDFPFDNEKKNGPQTSGAAPHFCSRTKTIIITPVSLLQRVHLLQWG